MKVSFSFLCFGLISAVISITYSTAQDIVYTPDPTNNPDLKILASYTNESCTEACSRRDLVCSVSSLEAGNVYGLNDTLWNTADQVGGPCNPSKYKDPKTWTTRPKIRLSNRLCYPALPDGARSPYSCVARDEKNNRICSCFFIPSASPTISAKPSAFPTKTSLPTQSPTVIPSMSSSPTSVPTSQPTQTPTEVASSSPTKNPSAKPSVSPTTSLNEIIFKHENEPDIHILTSWFGESCGMACARHDLLCNDETLATADIYFTSETMNSTMTALGQPCTAVLGAWTGNSRPFTKISNGNTNCYPSEPIGRTYGQYSCSKVVSDDKSRICGCRYTPSSSPTISASPTSKPTIRPSSLPSVRPSSAPTTKASFSPTKTPSVQPSSSPTSLPSVQPSEKPTVVISSSPTKSPSAKPSASPTTRLNEIIHKHENDPDIHILTSWIGESCGMACARHDLLCSDETLATADIYFTSETMNSTMTALGEPCTKMFTEEQWTSRPFIVAGNCYPSDPLGRTYGQYSCSKVANGVKSRICGCRYTPSSSPTISASPTPKASSEPSSSPSVQPSQKPTAVASSTPTMNPSAKPSNSPTTYLNKVVYEHENHEDLHILTSWIGESCTTACARHDLVCDINSLITGDEYFTNATMSSSMVTLGEPCEKFVDEANGFYRPYIRWTDKKCFPSNPVDRTKYNCDTIIASTTASRVCSCWFIPSDQPTTSLAPTAAPTVKASLHPSASPSSTPTAAPSPRPTFGNVVDIDESETIVLPVAPEGELRTLVKRIKPENPETGEEILIPIGRSYDGRPWEGQKPYDLEFTLDGATDYTVSLEQSGNESTYQLRSYIRAFDPDSTTLTKHNIEIAKFLERTTFGPTNESISSWNYASPALWVKEQMYTTPATLHRKFYRERAGTRIPQSISAGAPQHPCEQNSRWRRFAFTRLDFERYVTIKGNSSSYVVYVDDEPRTEISGGLWSNLLLVENTPYKICSKPSNTHGGTFKLQLGNLCTAASGGNPYVSFSSSLPTNVLNLTVADTDTTIFKEVNAMTTYSDLRLLTVSLNDDKCSSIPVAATEPLFGQTTDGHWFLFDAMLVWEDNEVSSPLPDGGGKAFQYGAYCANVPRTFLNEDDCTLSTDIATCGPTKFAEAYFELNNSTVRQLYELSKRYVYAVSLHMNDGLGVDMTYSPCIADSRSRWMVIDDAVCADNITDNSTKGTLVYLLESSSDTLNVHMREIKTPEVGFVCIDNGDVIGTRLWAGGQCWQHVHPEHMNVYDMTYWTRLDTHMGNQVRKDKGEPNPIKQFAKDGNPVLTFPWWHEIYRWEINRENFPKLGRFGDEVRFLDLPIELRTEEVAVEFGAQGESESGEGVIVCGSPGESANNLALTNDEFDVALTSKLDSTLTKTDFEHQAQTVFNNIAIEEDDQLRQRVAWALNQIIPLAKNDIDSEHETEIYLAFYDIFVRNAFGNYRDILKEVSYSPMMAEMLSFRGSKSSQYVYDELKEVDVFPDENYAREIMQLFSVGLTPLKMDGTLASGENDEVYSNEDIMDGARAWTGFDRQNTRGNMESFTRYNRLDPMTVDGYWRDAFPKMNLKGGYIGDDYPLCVDLPDKAFLKKGSTYRLLGSSSEPERLYDDSKWDHDPSIRRVVLTPGDTSTLFGVLSANDKSIVILENNVNCNGMECNVDTLRVVQVNDTFYEYQKPPCVQMAFYGNGRKIKGNHKANKAMCANPGLPTAVEACCDSATTFVRNCEYIGERMTYNKAVSRCLGVTKENQDVSYPLGLCDFKNNRGESGCSSRDFDKCDCVKYVSSRAHWTNVECKIVAKINDEGKVAIVHLPQTTNEYGVSHSVSIENENWFRVEWESEFPSPSNNCSDVNLACQNFGTFCACETTMDEKAYFTSGAMPVDDLDVIDKLHIGSVSPTAYPDGTYYLGTQYFINGVQVWVSNGVVDENTIFEVSQYNKTKYYKNMVSKVKVGADIVFRNAPHFVSLHDPTKGEAIDETDAVLDNYFYSENTPPFIAYRLIQRFGISNPSSKFVERVASAFHGGFVSYDGESFGTKQYGDLAATVASIVLDPEMTSLSLEADPSAGALKEPLLKLLQFMRAMKHRNNDGVPLTLLFKLKGKIGQEAMAIPSVFSFFLPDYEAPGRIASADLVAPEAFDNTSPNVIGLLSGLFSMVKYGLGSNCDEGFGHIGCWNNPTEGNYDKSLGRLTYTPSIVSPDDGIDEMCLLLTAGRCSRRSKQIIKDAAFPTGVPSLEGLRIAQQLFATLPEFNSFNLVERTGEGRPEPEVPTPSDRPYKAVILLFLAGGCDSYNMLMPKNCPMYDEYAAVRGRLALFDNDTLPIDANTTQSCGCTKFGINPKLPVLQQLYDQKDAVFLANTGNMFAPVDKSNYKTVMETNLFAHDVQQRDVRQVDPYQDVQDTGVLGRLADTLTSNGYKTSSISVVGTSEALIGEPMKSPPVNYLDYKGITEFDPNPSSDQVPQAIKDLNDATTLSSGLHGDYWAQLVTDSIDQNAAFYDAISGAVVNSAFPDTSLGEQLEFVSGIMSTHKVRGKDRDLFYLKLNGFDTHKNMNTTLELKFQEINDAISAFYTEMVRVNMWNNVTVMIASDFGRTLTPNSGEGSDHAWAGNYFAVGGDLDGGKVHGQYPYNLTTDGDFNLGRGRLIPSTPWEAPWSAISEWCGVPVNELNKVLPNRGNFPDDMLLTKDILFQDEEEQQSSS